jgi:HEAT repeat protein
MIGEGVPETTWRIREVPMPSRKQSSVDFQEYVRNPAVRRSLEKDEKRFQRWLSALKSDSIPTAEIAALVEQLLDEKPSREHLAVLRVVGERARPALVAVLSDPRFADHPYSDNILDGTVLKEVLDLLRKFHPPEAVGPLTRLLAHPTSRTRQLASYALGDIGRAECVPGLLSVLNDSEADVRTYALMGCQFPAREGRVQERFREGLFPRVAELLDDPEFNVSHHAPRLLCMFDRARAAEHILNPSRFHADNKRLHELLENVREFDLPAPPERLLALLSEQKPRLDNYFVRRSCCDILKILARQNAPGTEQTIRAAAEWGDEEVGKAASEALGILVGVTDPIGLLLEKMGEGDINKLTEPQRAYFLVWTLKCEVSNGGFAQYFVNSSGDHADETLDALAMIGALQTADILRRAMNLFGADGPSSDQDERHEQLASRDDAIAFLRELDTEFYKYPDRLLERLADYARAHAQHFR